MILQECVSETVSKYFVPDLSPWQITVFQLLTAEKYYVLIRFHHMLLSQEGMDLGSFLTFMDIENVSVISILKNQWLLKFNHHLHSSKPLTLNIFVSHINTHAHTHTFFSL